MYLTEQVGSQYRTCRSEGRLAVRKAGKQAGRKKCSKAGRL